MTSSLLPLVTCIILFFNAWFIYIPTANVLTSSGGITSFSPMINNAVHVIMYGYYLAVAEGGPKLKTFLRRHKKWLTVLQMCQLTAMFGYSCIVFLPSCPAPLGVTWFYFPNVVFVYYMFYKFFKENYIRKQNTRTVDEDISKQNGNNYKNE